MSDQPKNHKEAALKKYADEVRVCFESRPFSKGHDEKPD